MSAGATNSVIVCYALQFGDMPDRPKSSSANLSHPFCKLVGHRKNLIALFVEHQMIIAEMRAADMPMRILGLQIESKRVGHDGIESGGNGVDIGRGKVGRRAQSRGVWTA